MMEYLKLVEFDLDMSLKKTAADLLQKIKNSYNPDYTRAEYANEIV